MNIRERVLGIDHPSTAATYNKIALVYQAMKDYEKSLEYYLKALAIQEKVFGMEHPSTVTSYNNIANVYYLMGNHTKFMDYSKKANTIIVEDQ